MFNIKMMRLRRYRVFLIFAAIVTFFLVRLAKQGDLGSAGEVIYQGYKSYGSDDNKNNNVNNDAGTSSNEKSQEIDVESLAHPNGHTPADKSEKKIPNTSESNPLPPAEQNIPTKTSQGIQDLGLPDRQPMGESQLVDEGIHAQPPGRQEPILLEGSPAPIHWVKQMEHFPVKSIIQLPTGRPKAIPRIQFEFTSETEEAKSTRVQRLQKVKDEFQHSWKGYRSRAWLHDEIKPVSGGYSDPFNGWAATLVDTLDTLWIMGFKADFEEAVDAVKGIDFTTALSNEIPVFETTIRYLGGLIAAYDISSAQYPVLLEKAKELGEILMSIFDTPNRLPILFYQWKPAFASQPHRAGNRVRIAEIGTLSMEFTRLAQLTKDSKYYDAVARLTDAIWDLQQRGTHLDGLFPEMVDASGCNRTATELKLKEAAAPKNGNHPEGYQPAMLETVKEPKKKVKPGQLNDLEYQVIPGAPGEPAKGRIETVNKGDIPRKLSKREQSSSPADVATEAIDAFSALEKLETDRVEVRDEPANSGSEVVPTSTKLDDWDCVPQGLGVVTGRESFSLGGSQDSAYEYFTKQYLLLGGLEPKYQTLHENTMKAMKEHLLFRPMIPDNRDILFSGRIMITTNPDDTIRTEFDAEITHLTCFVGGMVGMGAKVFPSTTDLEIAKQLTDGCVWAYESMQSGLMPEYAKAIPCLSPNNCPWNQTLWEQDLDPLWDKREQMIRDFEDNKLKIQAQKETDAKEAEAQRLEAEQSLNSSPAQQQLGDADQIQKDSNEKKQAPFPSHQIIDENKVDETKTLEQQREIKAKIDTVWEESNIISPAMLTDVDSKAPPSTRDEISFEEAKGIPASDPKKAIIKRQVPPIDASNDASPRSEIPQPVTHDFRNDVLEMKQKLPSSNPPQNAQQDPSLLQTPDKLDTTSVVDPNSIEGKLLQKLKDTEEELDGNTAGKQIPSGTFVAPGADNTVDVDINRPLSHEAFIKVKLEGEKIPLGFSQIIFANYILR